MIEHILYLSIGAIFATFGVLAGALADRIRHGRARRAARDNRPRDHVAKLARDVITKESATDRMRSDVVLTLTCSGYTKAEAGQAADACHGSERSTIEAWTRAALRRLAATLEARS